MNQSSAEKPAIPIYLHRLYLLTGSVSICVNYLAFYMICSRSINKQDTVFALITQTVMTALSIWSGFFYQVYVYNDIYVNSIIERFILYAIYSALLCTVGVCLAAQLFLRQQAIAPIGSILKIHPMVAYVLIGIHFILWSVSTVIIYLLWHYIYKPAYPNLMDYYIAGITFTGAGYFVVFYLAMRMHVNILARDKTNLSMLRTHKKAMRALNAQVINLFICFGLPLFLDKMRALLLVKYTIWYNVLFYIGYIVPANVCIPNCLVMLLLTKRYRDAIKEWFRSVLKATSGMSMMTVSTTDTFFRRKAASSMHK